MEMNPSPRYAFSRLEETMESNTHSLDSLFSQLGLDSSPQAIEDFTLKNKPVPGDIELDEAVFWNASQASFLRVNPDFAKDLSY